MVARPKVRSARCGRCGKEDAAGGMLYSGHTDTFYCSNLIDCEKRGKKPHKRPSDSVNFRTTKMEKNGVTTFRTVGFGRDAAEAFTAVDGISGRYSLFALPSYTKIDRALELIADAVNHRDEHVSDLRVELAAAVKTRAGRGEAKKRASQIKRVKDQIKASEKFWGALRPDVATFVRQASLVYEENDIVCFELAGPAATEAKEQAGLAGTHKSAFLFYGVSP